MKKSISFPAEIEAQLMAYRQSRKSETGKLMFRETAIVELLQVALKGYEPPQPIDDRLDDIERRLALLEGK